MNLKKYEAFYYTATLGSVTAAAGQMGCSQSALSHLLLDFEKDLGFPLLTKNRAGAKLTSQGGLLLPEIKTLLKQVEKVSNLAEKIRENQAGTIRIATFTSVAVHWLPRMMQAFGESHPLVDFKLENGDYYDVETWLKNGSVDLGFVPLPGPQGIPVLELYRDRLLAILSKNHPLSALSKLPVSVVEKEKFISLLESSNHDARRVLDAGGVTPNVAYTTKDDYAIIAMVAQGLGISIMPELLLRGQSDHVAVLDLDPPAYRTIGIAVPNMDSAPLYLKEFITFVQKWVKDNG
ncbi:MAG: LysR family transcriptional regulator [Eubacteriales bacterium]|nr:LysR family transcriptional regulator [Eubacteriales bacterium]